MAISENPLLKGISGSINKEIVVKQYVHRTVITKYPDMSNVIPSARQERSNSLFADAVKYAKWILADKRRFEEYKQSMQPGERVYNHAIKSYMAIHKA